MTILPQLEHDLLQAAKERLPASDPQHGAQDQLPSLESQPTQRRSFRRRTAATATVVPILLAVAVTVIVAALALTLFHRGPQLRPAAPPISAETARKQLIEMLGVLRRPQAKSDLDSELTPEFVQLESIAQASRRHKRPQAGLERRLAQWGYPKLDRSLVRVVKTPAWHAKVGIEPSTWRPTHSSSQRSEGIDLELWIGSKPTIPPSSDEGTGPPPASIDTVRDHGLALADNVRGGSLLDGVVLVPDGVARVTLRVLRVIRSPVSVSPSEFGTATAAVRDNIAAFQLSIPTAPSRTSSTGLFGTSALAQATWFDASGKVIKHTTTNLDVLIKVERK
jgi:hypothetical protein